MSQKTNISNYRPISLQPMPSKVIEKVVHEKTTKFSNDGNIFSFRNNQSTGLFRPFLNGKILKSFDNRVYSGMILINLKKTFYIINHKILLDKLLPIGFSKNKISWYESCLAERHFIVEVTNPVSKFANILCGVPQA